MGHVLGFSKCHKAQGTGVIARTHAALTRRAGHRRTPASSEMARTPTVRLRNSGRSFDAALLQW
eukprot:scaffold17572_cov32-Tisochrysis_lutea.AAC.2